MDALRGRTAAQPCTTAPSSAAPRSRHGAGQPARPQGDRHRRATHRRGRRRIQRPRDHRELMSARAEQRAWADGDLGRDPTRRAAPGSFPVFASAHAPRPTRTGRGDQRAHLMGASREIPATINRRDADAWSPSSEQLASEAPLLLLREMRRKDGRPGDARERPDVPDFTEMPPVTGTG